MSDDTKETLFFIGTIVAILIGIIAGGIIGTHLFGLIDLYK